MKIELKYFSGTGNSLKILNTCREVFKLNGHHAGISSITEPVNIDPDADLLGFCFPVYAFGIPRICRNYLRALEAFPAPVKAFVLITAGLQDESGFAIPQAMTILKKKNCRIVYSSVIEMPINWTVSMNPPSKDEANTIIDKGVARARYISTQIMKGRSSYHRFKIPDTYSSTKFYKDYLLFRYIGVANLWRYFRVYDSCNGCGICEKTCPTRSIQMESEKPEWSSGCEQCMRCVNICPRESIYQKGGETTGRNRYLEPSFKPLKNAD